MQPVGRRCARAEGARPGQRRRARRCLSRSAPRQQRAGAPVDVTIGLTYAGKAVDFRQPNPRAGGGTFTPTDLTLFVSEVALLADDGRATPVDLVDAAGAPEPYRVHLYRAGDAATETFRFVAPAGRYAGLRFLLGLTDACNGGEPGQRKPPLASYSDMTWPHLPGLGSYLFLRYGGQVAGGGSTAAVPTQIHMGGGVGTMPAPTIQVRASIVVAPDGARMRMDAALDEIFAGATADVDVSRYPGPPSPELVAGERLRQTAAMRHVFSIAP